MIKKFRKFKKFQKFRKFKKFSEPKKFFGSKKPKKILRKPKSQIVKKLMAKRLTAVTKQSSAKKTKKQKIFSSKGGSASGGKDSKVVIKIVGIGGCGGNVITDMVTKMQGEIFRNISLIAINTDIQDLDDGKAQQKIYIGKNLTKGLGTGMNPELGQQAADESRGEIVEAIKGADLVFVIAGLGGGTGTGGVPLVAQLAKETGALTIAAVTTPFSFEGAQRARIAEEGLKNLIEIADTTIIIRNNRILEIIDKETTLSDAFALCNNVLINAVRGISEPILKPGIINLDFADVKTIMAEAGPAVMGIGQANGDERAIEAAKKAVSFPLLNISIDGAKGILFSVASRKPLTLSEVNEVAKIITASADPDAKIIFGVIRDESLKKGELKVTVVATGFSGQGSEVIPKRKDK